MREQMQVILERLLGVPGQPAHVGTARQLAQLLGAELGEMRAGISLVRHKSVVT